MNPLAERGLQLSRRLWRTTRHDIGRKLTALGMAVALWLVLQGLVIARQPLELPVRPVATQAEADQERLSTPGVYLIVPDELIVRAVSEPRVHVTVSGLRDQVVGLNMSAKLLFTLADLGEADEIALTRPLERDVFAVPQGQVLPRLTSFRVRPEALTITLARRATAEVTLSAENVETSGAPKEGYFFRSSSIRLSPSTVGLTGPLSVLGPLLADPAKVKLDPVAMTGKSVTVSQWVGLSRELREQGVSLQSGGSGQVLVTVPIEAEHVTKDLFAVPIEYRNEDVLELRQQRVTSCPKTLDIRLVGPPAELDGRPEDLLANIVLVFDWERDAPQTFEGEATGKVTAYRAQLPDSVRVTDSKDKEELKIEYTLEKLTAPGPASGQ
ncbi:MAG TPA: hypothetical protein VFD43_02410 [Planctomycetota bacterium]|nr:hypothetical protein [Planctomycetota bacterium]